MSSEPDLRLEVSQSNSGTKTGASNAVATQIQGSGSPPPIVVFETSEFLNILGQLQAFEAKAANLIIETLAARVAGAGPQADDDIFLPHTVYAATALDASLKTCHGVELLPARLWLREIWPRVIEAEQQLKQSNPNARIHKGAPFFNNGLCFFVAGDFERAIQYFAEAGKEDELSGRGSRYLVPSAKTP